MVWVAEAGVDRGGRGQHVSRVAEGWQVTHVGHVTRQRAGAAERGALVLHALGELVETVARPLAALGFAGHFAVAGLDALLFHGQRSVHLRGGIEATVSTENRASGSMVAVVVRLLNHAVGSDKPSSPQIVVLKMNK